MGRPINDGTNSAGRKKRTAFSKQKRKKSTLPGSSGPKWHWLESGQYHFWSIASDQTEGAPSLGSSSQGRRNIRGLIIGGIYDDLSCLQACRDEGQAILVCVYVGDRSWRTCTAPHCRLSCIDSWHKIAFQSYMSLDTQPTRGKSVADADHSQKCASQNAKVHHQRGFSNVVAIQRQLFTNAIRRFIRWQIDLCEASHSGKDL